MLDKILTELVAGEAYQALLDAIREGRTTALFDLCEGQRPFVASWIAEKTGRTVLLIAPSDAAATRMRDDCSQLLHAPAALLPAEAPDFTRGAASRELRNRRLETLVRARRGETPVVVATVEALQAVFPDAGEFSRHTLRLMTGDRQDPEQLIRRMVAAGYERVDMVEGQGQCSRRGEIVDVFPPDRDSAVRIEFFDDEIDSIRSFDCLSQRSMDRVSRVEIAPAELYLVPESARKSAADTIRRLVMAQIKRLPQDLLLYGGEAQVEEGTRPSVPRGGIGRLLDDADNLEDTGFLPGARLWAGIAYKESGSWQDWLNNPIVLIDSPESLRARAEDRRAGFEEDFKYSLERQEAVPEQATLVKPFSELLEGMAGLPIVMMQDFLRDMSGIRPDLTLKPTGKAPNGYMTRLPELVQDIRRYRDSGYRVILLSGGQARGERLRSSLEELELRVPILEEGVQGRIGEPVILTDSLTHGMILPEERLCLISDSDIFGSGYRRARKARVTGEKLEAFTDLKEGDYVVHEHHGIGIFQGIARMMTEGTYRDYLKIQYQGKDQLFVPIDQFARVQKYIGSQEELPPLNSLGGGEWAREKKKVKAGLKKLAFDLVRLYADRKAMAGHAYAPDTPWQRQFEDAFPYELTPDQQRAVRDITQDMEAPTNMDRLLCGDVGYGKTEVALRAAFKAVMDGKQVALLAPTTILVQQHFLTVTKRMADFPIEVDMLSRFRTAKEQKETLKKLAEGKIDIIVGTHRLLGKDVRYKDLGLLIVDEEQRFGVGHKESIKRMKTSVDVLTLSATPIPRTLHMSMVGVRDMSLLETPPEERLPVQTYVIDYHDVIIRDAIRRELGKGGQVYFLYNRVQSIEEFRARLQALLPEARIVAAHGQMKENALEDIMLDFHEGRYDVLLSTTIIENGLDVPNANTLIVYDADRFGLSQLYQLRGRVGRSNRTAYAYFTVRPDKMISEDAQKRLTAIREFTEFGSGFRIAMRDLEIRGAGNIFGPEQSGNVSTVGYDMYVKLIGEAVREAQSELTGAAPEPERADTRVELKVDAFLPKEYVAGDVQRMEIYKRIALIRNREDREDVIEELIDRFGEPPEPVMCLIDIAHLRALSAGLGVVRVTFLANTLIMRLEPTLSPDPEKLFYALGRADERLMLSASKEPAILLRDKRLTVDRMLKEAVPVMEKVVKELGNV
ncbi:MAG: transcription-repair coupling factor [Clostridia bacterium]|nr:transcription-repair coupling factor [Clostridia bacterium]